METNPSILYICVFLTLWVFFCSILSAYFFFLWNANVNPVWRGVSVVQDRNKPIDCLPGLYFFLLFFFVFVWAEPNLLNNKKFTISWAWVVSLLWKRIMGSSYRQLARSHPGCLYWNEARCFVVFNCRLSAMKAVIYAQPRPDWHGWIQSTNPRFLLHHQRGGFWYSFQKSA